jgi:hypothetical protein
MKTSALVGACVLAFMACAPVVLAGAEPVATAAKCTKKLSAAGKCSLLVARYDDPLTAFKVSVSQRGKTRTAKVTLVSAIKCLGGADPDGTLGDGSLTGAGTVNAKGKYSGTFTGQTDSGVAISGTLHGTIAKKKATLAGTVTGSRTDPDHPPDLQCTGTIAAEAERAS